MSLTIEDDLITRWRQAFYSNPKNNIAQNYCRLQDPINACYLHYRNAPANHPTYKIETEGKPYADQHSSGCSWIYAGLNLIRLPFMRHFNLDDFEFSQAYLLYWHKIERCNFYLNTAVKLLRQGEQPDDRCLSYLLKHPALDGGQWPMLVSLIKKYGLMPKPCYLVSKSANNTKQLNVLLHSKLREYVCLLHRLITKEQLSAAAISKRVEQMMAELYKVISICLGVPQMSFTWSYYNKAKAPHVIGPQTPLEFYQQHVKPHFELNDYVCLGADPRPKHSYGQFYAVEYCTNQVDGKYYTYMNQPADRLLTFVIASIRANVPVWCGCDAQRRFSAKVGILSLDLHDFEMVYGVKCRTVLDKAERMLYRESQKSHAMILTAVAENVPHGKMSLRAVTSVKVVGGGNTNDPRAWGIGRRAGNKGYVMHMSAEWFKEFVFEIVIDKRFVPPELLMHATLTPELLPIWDTMGNMLG